jgi:hypothetical protein
MIKSHMKEYFLMYVASQGSPVRDNQTHLNQHYQHNISVTRGSLNITVGGLSSQNFLRQTFT